MSRSEQNPIPAAHMAAPAMILLACWVLVIWLINPVGEFTTNDDWSFVQSYKALFDDGRMIPTGWGQGGPALITHLLWGGLFANLFGDSITVLRVSVLSLGVTACFSMLFLLRSLVADRWVALLGALILTFNPFFLSLAFTYMTDVTFASLLVFALAALHQAQQRSPYLWLCVALLLALSAILTRQIGIVIPLAIIVSALFQKGPRGIPRTAAIGLTIGLSLLPWIGWEWFLSWVGSTPVTQHDVFTSIISNWVTKGPADYFNYALVRLFWVILPYSALFLLPILILQAPAFFKKRSLQVGLSVYGAFFLCFEAAVLGGMIEPPVVLYHNNIINFGLGPLLFKDTYLMGLPALTPLHPVLFYLLVFLGAGGGRHAHGA